MKLCSACPSVVIHAASSLPQLLSALHSATSQPPGALRGLSVRSAALLLVAATDLVAYTCNHHANSQTNPTELATALLGPPLGLLQQAATGSTGDAPLDEASRAASRLASILPRLPKTLQAAAAELMMPWSAALIHLLGLPVTEHEEASSAAREAIVAMLIGCGRHVSPIVPTLADAAWAHFERGNITPRDFKLVDAIARCAARAPESPNAVALDASPKRHAVNPSSESNASAASAALVSRLANALAELQPRHRGGLSDTAGAHCRVV